ncbi:S-adenosyl-L-methionine-dependent methyltransferase [Stipitochalara longipes BDJ]|nr:S-adenosyl-L-methionine-dependent methyltransferase [Stipitochalara longipes BDJ]
MSTPTAPTEKTFSSFTKEQGANYAQHRRGYHPKLLQTIIDHHTSTGGKLDTLVDVGCGPGTTALDLASYFKHVIGLDPSEGMIATARSSTTDPKLHFDVSTAEDLGSHLSPPVADESVDLITASTAAHWFNMSLFWPRAAEILKPGGSVAIWTTGSVKIHPSMPNSAAIQASMDDIEARELAPFFEPGNLMTRNLYRDLVLPWTVSPKVEEFDEGSFLRKDYGSEQGNEEEFLVGSGMELNLDLMEKMLGTGSPVQRWREANKEKVGTEGDVVKLFRREIERLLHEAGVEKGKEVCKGSLKGVLLIVKKKA